MSGDATFAGTNYQASVVAYVFVHVLTETKLRWVALADDTPSAVSGEVGGPGDDARVEFRTGSAPIEIQAKHGLKPQKCIDAFEAIRDGSTPGDTTGVILVVDSTSSPAVRNDLWRDLDRLRSGRDDNLKELTRNIASALGSRAEDVMRRTHILTLDLGRHSDAGATRALEILIDSLNDESQAVAAWSVLEKDAALMCAEKTRRTKRALLDVLAKAGITVRPPRQTRKWHEELRYTEKLLADDDRSALALLLRVEALFADIETAGAAERQANAQEAERLCTEVLDGEASLSTSRTQRALVSRSLARRNLGKTTTAGRVIRDGLEAMAVSFQPLAVARAVVRAANAELALLPRDLQLVKGASMQFLKSRALRS